MSQVIDKPAKQTRKRASVAEAAAAAVEAPKGDTGASIRTSMDTIADEARAPITKAEIPAGGLDQRMTANNLANRVIATVRQDAKSVWRKFAIEVISLATDGRVQFLKTLREWLNEARKIERNDTRNEERNDKGEMVKAPTKEERKAAAARVASATVEVSKLMTIAEAWNGQATEAGLLLYYNEATGKAATSAEEVPYERIVQYARTFSKSAAGRAAQPFLLRVAKMLEACKPRTGDEGPDGEADVALHAALVAAVAEAASKQPAEAQAAPQGL